MSTLGQGVTLLEPIRNNRLITGSFTQTASQLELRQAEFKRQAAVLSEHLLEELLEDLSLRHVLFQTACDYRLGQVLEALKWECCNIISVNLAALEEQHIAFKAKIAQTNTARLVKIGASITNYFTSARADIFAAGELL